MSCRQLTRFLQQFSTTPTDNLLSFGFSGAGFLGCYHVGVAACLYRQGLLPNPNDSSSSHPPRVTGVSAGSMIASAVLAGVKPDPDGMEVVLEAARKTRQLANANNFNVSLDVLTPGFSLIDQVEDPFRKAIVTALGGRIPEPNSENSNECSSRINIYDVDPELFSRRFPCGSLRLGLADRRVLGPGKILESYRYIDSFRDVDDIVATCMLSSYIPGGTGPLHLHDKVPDFLSGLFNRKNTTFHENSADSTDNETRFNDTVHRAGVRLRFMESAGLVKHGKTGLSTKTKSNNSMQSQDQPTESNSLSSTDFWDGGIADVFPTFDEQTIIIAPVNGKFFNPAICPDPTQSNATSIEPNNQPSQYLQSLILSYLPKTFQHCHKAQLGLNAKNAKAALKMIFSSDDEELYQIFRDGYDDAQ